MVVITIGLNALRREADKHKIGLEKDVMVFPESNQTYEVWPTTLAGQLFLSLLRLGG